MSFSLQGLSLSRSSCNSLNSSQSDVTSLSKAISDKSPPSASSETKSDESQQRLLSLQTTHQNLKMAYQYLLKQFDLMTVLNQYFLTEVKLNEKHKHLLFLFLLIQNQQSQQISQQRLTKGRISSSFFFIILDRIFILSPKKTRSITEYNCPT